MHVQSLGVEYHYKCISIFLLKIVKLTIIALNASDSWIEKEEKGLKILSVSYLVQYT